jgi:hypothetical protein
MRKSLANEVLKSKDRESTFYVRFLLKLTKTFGRQHRRTLSVSFYKIYKISYFCFLFELQNVYIMFMSS